MASDLPNSVDSPRVLFVISGDYGELLNAAWFVHNTEIEHLILLPEALAAKNDDRPPFECRSFATDRDVISQAEEFRADVVLLFSGYLMCLSSQLSPEQLSALIYDLTHRGITVATSDPFLGMLSKTSVSGTTLNHPARDALRDHFSVVADILQNVCHVSHAPADESMGTSHLPFFNPKVPFSDVESDGSWLFVLSNEDFGLQQQLHGGQFARLLNARLSDAAQQGATPVLQAPAACLKQLAKLDAPSSLITNESLSYRRFVEVLGKAEFTFYWNQFSASLLYRAMDSRPFFIFDRGHLSRALPEFHQHAAAHFYHDCDIKLTELSAPLNRKALTQAFAECEAGLDTGRRHLKESPSPIEFLDTLCST